MKRVFAFVTTVFLAASLMMAQTTGDQNAPSPKKQPPKSAPNAKPQATTKGKTAQKGGKKGHKGAKKNSGGTTTTPQPK